MLKVFIALREPALRLRQGRAHEQRLGYPNPIGFMVDTGASHIALRASDAARLGFHPWPRDYSIKIGTANGEGRAALVQLGTVEIGTILVRDLPALVSPDEALGINLLGMSFLSRVRWSHDHGNLIIEQ